MCIRDRYKALFEEIASEVDDTFKDVEPEFPGLDVNLTGSMATLMVMADEVANSQFNSFALALLIVSLIMMISWHGNSRREDGRGGKV